MASLTSRLKLLKPARTENVNILTQLNDNLDKIDAAMGTTVVTSTTRPGAAERYTGMFVYETDTNRVAVFTDEGVWKYVDYIEDSGWVNPGTYAAGFAASGNYPPKIRKRGPQVFLRGMVQYKSGALYGTAIITIPEGYRPNEEVFLGAHKASGGHETVIGNLFLTIDGRLMVPTGYGGGTLPGGTYFPLNGSWFVD